MVTVTVDPSCKMSTRTRSNLSAQFVVRQELLSAKAAATNHPPVHVADDDAAEAYLGQAVKMYTSLSPVEGSKDAWSLHSSSNSSLPQSTSISRLGPTHSGVFTGRSSATSWEIDDEFDQASRHNVQQILDQIFGALYQEGGVEDGSKELQEECLQWGGTFPHLRLVGRQVCAEHGDGTEEGMVDTPPATAEPRPRVQTQGETTLLPDYKSLSVMGRRLQPVAVYCVHKELSDECSIVEEEVIAAHGTVEEYIAFDNMEEEQHPYSRSRRRNHRYLGFPPVTPNACVRDTVCSQVFDQIWAEIVTVLRPLLQNQNLMDRCHSFIRSRDGSALETMPPLVPSTALPHMFPSLRDQPTLMRATGQFGSQPLRLRPVPLPMLNRDYTSREDRKATELQEVMKIRSLPLQKRLSSTLDPASTSELWDPRAETGPFTFRSRFQPATPVPSRLSDLQMGGMLGHPAPISGKGRRNVQLKPLEKPKTPALPMEDLIKDFGGLKGQKLNTHNDFGSPPPGRMQSPLPWVRNTQLPPLEDLGEKRSPPPPRSSAYKNRVVTFASRVSSAAAGHRSNADIQKPLPVLLNDPRPSTTTSSFRTETPKSMSRRGSNQSVSNIALSQTPKVSSGGVLGVGIIGHAAGIYSELRERYEDEEETIFEEDDNEMQAEEDGEDHSWKGPLYLSPFWSKPRAKLVGVMKYRGPMR